MANKKISAMTAASALTGPEVTPGVQGGANVKISATQQKAFSNTSPAFTGNPAKFPVFTFAAGGGQIPAAASFPYGRCFVTDALTTLTLGIGTTASGGGANKVPVYSDGTNWLYG
jgi:hypothetical protein